nr:MULTISPECIES: hypothetical protein [unclassified Butyricicoccus]
MYDILGALAANFDEVHYMDFYRDVFPEGSFEERGVFEDGKYNGIAVAIEKGSKRAKRMTITDDLDVIGDMAGTDDFCLMSPISYAGKSRKSSNARFMYALAIDLDGIEERKQWEFFMEQIERGHEMLKFVWGLPRPTYLVSSGTGIHLYYVFKQPIPMFKNIVEELEKLKRRLTWQAWTQGASSLHDKVQYESLFQGFRVVGTITKDGGRCRAFSVGEKVTVEYLNKFVPEEYRAENFAYKSDLRLEDAKKKYPEWYQRRVVEKRPKNTWTCKKALYDWWIKKLLGGAEQGHRYWCIMTLATYAQKCGVPRETLEEDAYGLIPFMNTKGDEFTEDDVLHALEAYTDSYITYPIDTIVWRTGIQIEKNKRNGRKRADHVKLMNFVRDEINGNKNWREGNGRPDKLSVVAEWRSEHPEGTKAECIRETGLSKPTVYRWWREIDLMELREYTNKEKMVQLSGDESQRKAVEIVAAVTAIAQERGLSEEEAYEVFLHGKTGKEQVQEQAKHMVFAESEVDAGLLVGCAANGIRRINVMPDDEYMNYLATDCVNALFPPKNRK